MRHQDLTINHRLESWVYANAAARTGATGFVAGDVGRIAFQTDTGQYWRLTATTPTWALIGPPTILPAYASLQTAQLNPAGTASTTSVMMGMGSSASITPTVTGKILVTVSGTIFNANANGGAGAGIRYGTGTAPANGAAPAGTAIGGGAVRGVETVANIQMPFSLSAVITGLAIGTPVWIDLGVQAITAGNAWVSATVVTAVELP